MEEQCDGTLGLVILYPGKEPEVDIVAVHGLGANAEWAWIRKVKDEQTGLEKHINWLKDGDMLPADIPNARIMTFNYESKWHKDAPKQRRVLCADQLLTALDNQRKEEKSTRNRPIIFIGHSFGGIVIEQAIVSANQSNSPFYNIAISTVGINFLGTPHRGTAATKWAEIIARSGKALGLGSEDSILKDLREDSETLKDVLDHFSAWLFRRSVPAICFFEQHETDYGARYGFKWKQMVVPEHNACIDGHRKVALPVDHFKINKFAGRNDPCYKYVVPVIKSMVVDALGTVDSRLEHINLPNRLKCLNELFLTNPQDDIAGIRQSKGKRVQGTCQWLLSQPGYIKCLSEEGFQLLRLTGAPGIGKTMLSTYLVDELENKVQQAPGITFIYYFCDNKDEKRNTGVTIIRGLLWQILTQHPSLFKHVQPDYDNMTPELFQNFDALWRMLQHCITDAVVGELFILVDALDECQASSRQKFLQALVDLIDSERVISTLKLRLIITHRPQPEIDEFFEDDNCIRVDSGNVNDDLARFIEVKVTELAKKKKYPEHLADEIKTTLTDKAGGTFLWASLVLNDISRTTMTSKVRSKLKNLPSELYKVYDRILLQISDEDKEDAILILQAVVSARRPLTISELAMIRAMKARGPEEEYVPPPALIKEYEDGFMCCEPLIQLDMSTNTVNLVHQSAKDYLLNEVVRSHSQLPCYYITETAGNLFMLQVCLQFLAFKDFDYLSTRTLTKFDGRIRADGRVVVRRFWYYKNDSENVVFLAYAVSEWEDHACAADAALSHDQRFIGIILDKRKQLRDSWLRSAAFYGLNVTVAFLLRNGADVDAGGGLSNICALHAGVEGGNKDTVRLLLDKATVAGVNKLNYYSITPLQITSRTSDIELVRLLLDKGAVASINTQDFYGCTPLFEAIRRGKREIVRLLLDHGAVASINTGDFHGCTPLFEAIRRGKRDIVRLLLGHGATINLDTQDHGGCTPLHQASGRDNIEIIRLLLDRGASINIQDGCGCTPLHEALGGGKIEIVRLLLNRGAVASLQTQNEVGDTPLHEASRRGKTEIVRLLLERGAAISIQTQNEVGNTPLHEAVYSEDVGIARLLIDRGADIKIENGRGRTAIRACEQLSLDVIKMEMLSVLTGRDKGSPN